MHGSVAGRSDTSADPVQPGARGRRPVAVPGCSLTQALDPQGGGRPQDGRQLGPRGLQEALDLLEYCNHPGGTALSDLRRSHGAEGPYGIRTWCLGNEMDGPWQLGHEPAAEHGRMVGETARAMRQLDPRLSLVVCGSSYQHMPTFGAWEAIVLEQTYDERTTSRLTPGAGA